MLEARIVLDSTLVFNEIQYHSAADQNGLEWIEFHNQLAVDLDVSRWRLAGGADFAFPEGTTAPGGGFLVIANDPSEMLAQTGYSGALGPFTGQLSNGGEELWLLNNNDRHMDRLNYNDTGDWTSGPDGSGFTLVKDDLLHTSGLPAHWITSTTRGGTPGADRAETTPAEKDLHINEMSAASDLNFFIEIKNEGSTTHSLTNYQIVSSADPVNNVYVLPAQSIASGGFVTVTETQLGFDVNDGDTLFVFSSSQQTLIDARRVTENLRGRSTEHAGSWLYPHTVTPGTANLFQFAEDVVINEILYHPFNEQLSGANIVTEDVVVTQFVRRGDDVSVFIPTNDSLGNSWQLAAFNDASWITGPTGIGFESSSVTDAIAYGNLTGAGGSSSLSGPYGHDFTVNSSITIDQLGVFDSNADGLSRTLTTEIWSRNGNTGTKLTKLVFTPGEPGTLVNSNRFKSLTTPLVLSPGEYTVTAHGFGSNERAGHQGFGGPSGAFKTLDDGSGAISFVGSSRLGTTPGTFPSQSAGGTANYFSAGTFQFSTGGILTGEINTDIESVMLGTNASAYLRHEFEATAVEPGQSPILTLRMKYDDGFIVSLNGTEVARRNAPLNVTYDASATQADQLLSFEAIDLSAQVGLLQTGTNVLAIQGLNADILDGDFLIVPELELQAQAQIQTQWLELYNRGTSTTDLTGWKLEDGIDFVFAPGTTIAPGAYLVVAANAAQLATSYPGVDIVGDFSGELGNREDSIQLTDHNGNPADEVHYYQDGYWPELADGGGSSLELRDPHADNSKPGAWAASKEDDKTDWSSYTYRGTALPFESDGPQYHELVIGLLDAGQILVDDITVIQDPNGIARPLIQNTDFESDTLGTEADFWRIYGNHFGTVIQDPDDAGNQVLHLTATGNAEDMHNHGETTFRNGATYYQIVPGTEYEISFRAKWLGGSNQFNTRLYYNSAPATTRLPVPALSGTPGAANSHSETNIGPTFSGFQHGPVVPNSGQAVTVTAVAEDPQGVSSATLHWRTVSGSFGTWQSTTMTVSGDGTLTGTIPGRNSSTVIQFYVEAIDGLGATSLFPRAGTESRALYKVQDHQAGGGPQKNLRIIQPTSEINFQLNQINRMSNHRFGGTVVLNESEAFYDVGVRLKGASSSRPSSSHGYNIRFHTDNRFLGVHNTITVDRNNVPEFLIKHLNNRADDVPSMYNDAVYLIDPGTSSKNGVFQLRLAGYSDVYLDEQFQDGANGMLIDKEIIYRPNGTNNGSPEGRKLPGYHHTTQGSADIGEDHFGTDKEGYRLQWRVKNNRERDDLSQIVALNEAFRLRGTISDTQWNTTLNELMDVDQWMRVLAAVRLAGVVDYYSQSPWNHNYLVYPRPDTGQLLMLPWDLDIAFSNNTPLVGTFDHPVIRSIVQIPENLRLLYGHFDNLIDTAYNSTYASTWASHFNSMFPQTSFSSAANYIGNRSSSVASQLPTEIPFEVTTLGPLDVGTSSTATIEGKGWVNVREIRLTGNNVPLIVDWSVGAGASYAETWDVTLPLQTGANDYTLEAYDFEGNLIGSETIMVTTLIGDPIFDSLRITELNYNPADPTNAELLVNPTLDDDDFEFVEVLNVGTQTIHLQNVSFVEGLDFSFPATTLAPGEYGVIVQDISAFQLRYGASANVLGAFTSGRLSNSGETLRLAVNSIDILDFSYMDNSPWPERADGIGASLELIDPVHTNSDEFDKHYHWRGSTEWGGSPGTAGMGPIGVVVNEVLSHSERPTTPDDSIELLNTTASAIDIGGWYLSDSGDNLIKFAISEGTILAAGQYIVFDESDFNPNPSNPGLKDFALNASAGDDVWLVNPDGVGGILHFVDDIHFGAALPGETFGRSPNGTGILTPMQSRTLGASNSPPRVGPVVISEVNYHPNAPSLTALSIEPELVEGDLEYVELYNPLPYTVDLTDWRLEGGISFDFLSGTTIAPGQFLLVLPFDPNNAANANRLAAFQEHYVLTPFLSVVGGFSGGLNNGTDLVSLHRAEDPPTSNPGFTPYVVEDKILYDDLTPWPVAADGTGQSLHRVASDAWAGDATAWTAGLPSPGRYGPVITAELLTGTTVIGEVGQVTDMTHAVQTVTLNHTYANPVVIALPVSTEGTDVAIVRVNDIQSNQFELYLTEPSNLNGMHGVAETISYIVLEAGVHVLDNGTMLEVGTVNTGATVGQSIPSPTWETVNFTAPFIGAPIVMTHVQSGAGTPFLSTRQEATTSTGFQVALQPEELVSAPQNSLNVGYLAIEAHVGSWNGIAYEAIQTSRLFTELFTNLTFQQAYTSAPHFIASLASFHGGDNSTLRYDNMTNVGVGVKVEEDTTLDIEVGHTAEEVSYLALDGAGLLTARQSLVNDDQAHTFQIHHSGQGTINDLNVTLALFHSYSSDLDVFLESPSGSMVELFTDMDTDGDHFFATTLDDQAAQSISSAAGPSGGTWQPEGLLAAFSGETANGIWQLHVTDDSANGESGNLVDWSLDIELAPAINGNLNYDGTLDDKDIDLLFASLGSTDSLMDVDHDGDTDATDVDELILNMMDKRYGDSDLDQDVDIADFARLVRHYSPLGTSHFLGWADGNFDGDNDVDINDFNQLATNFAPTGYASGNLTLPVSGDGGSVVLLGENPSRNQPSLAVASSNTITTPLQSQPSSVEQQVVHSATDFSTEDGRGSFSVRPKRTAGNNVTDDQQPLL